MIDLAVHVIAADEVGLDGMYGAVADDDAGAVTVEHLEDALDIEEIVLDAGHITVAEDVVHAIGVELAGDDRMIPGVRLLRDALDDAFGHARVEIVQDAIDIAVLAHDVRAGHGLVIEVADGGDAGLEGMAESGMADVVQKRRSARDRALERVAVGAGAVEYAARHMLRAQRVPETRVLGAVIDKARKAELADTAKALDDLGIDQAEQHAIDLILHIEMNDIVNWIPE